MALRAVIFDYGMVLTGPPAPEAIAALLRITGLPEAQFSVLYWKHRHAFDEGKLTGRAFWQAVGRDGGLALSSQQVEELADWDARMWTTENTPMLQWQQQLQARGIKTAILSNMGDSVHARMLEVFDWLDRFDVLVWSYQLRLAKPDAAIYEHVLRELAVQPREALFVDDKLVNVEAARELGMQAHVFATPQQLRQELIEQGLDAELPLPV